MNLIMNLFYVSVLVCLGGGAIASSAPLARVSTSPYRLGFGLAAELLNTEAKFKFQPSAGLSNISTSHSQTSKKIQLAPTFEFGRTFCDNYYLGLQVSWRKSKVRSSSTSTVKGANLTFEHEFKLRSYTDLFLKVGYKPVPQFMFYGLVGPSIAKWAAKTDQLVFNDNTNQNDLSKTFKMKETSTGLGLGVGAEYLVQNKFAISLEYAHHIHRAKKQVNTMEYSDINLATRRPYTRTGTITRSVQPSYSTIALRVTFFVSPF